MFNTYKNYYKKFFSFTLSFFIILSTGKKVTKAETFDLSGSSENKNYDQPIYINWDKQFNDMFIPIDTKSFFLKFRSSSWIENCKDHNLNVEQSKKNAGDITHNLNLSIKYAHEVINRIDHFYKDTSEKAKKYSESTWFVESEFEKLNEKFKKIKKDLINKKKNI
ncbi:MAG: hypothetical protein FWC41_10360, partial [Firmicutes bacterium]|nr:hypothetical protein [Bacillota bacterium]